MDSTTGSRRLASSDRLAGSHRLAVSRNSVILVEIAAKLDHGSLPGSHHTHLTKVAYGDHGKYFCDPANKTGSRNSYLDHARDLGMLAGSRIFASVIQLSLSGSRKRTSDEIAHLDHALTCITLRERWGFMG